MTDFWNERDGQIRSLNPAIIDQGGIIGDNILTQMRRANICPGISFYTCLLCASAVAVAELRMSEDRFLDLCRQQYRLYLEFQFDQTGGVKT